MTNFDPLKNDFLTLCVKLTPFESPKCVQICHTQTYFSGKMSGPANQQNKTPFCTISIVHRQFFPSKNQFLINFHQILGSWAPLDLPKTA